MDVDDMVDDGIDPQDMAGVIEVAMHSIHQMNGKTSKYLLSHLENLRDECESYEDNR